jgi:hypothetical protein
LIWLQHLFHGTAITYLIGIVCKDGHDSHIVGLSIKITLAKVMNSGPTECRISGKHRIWDIRITEM